jgi:hypothetical protein
MKYTPFIFLKNKFCQNFFYLGSIKFAFFFLLQIDDLILTIVLNLKQKRKRELLRGIKFGYSVGMTVCWWQSSQTMHRKRLKF